MGVAIQSEFPHPLLGEQILIQQHVRLLVVPATGLSMSSLVAPCRHAHRKLGARFQQDEFVFDVFSPSQDDTGRGYIHYRNVHMAERVLRRVITCHHLQNPYVHHRDHVRDLK